MNDFPATTGSGDGTLEFQGADKNSGNGLGLGEGVVAT